MTRRPEASNSSSPWVMLLMAESRCWLFSRKQPLRGRVLTLQLANDQDRSWRSRRSPREVPRKTAAWPAPANRPAPTIRWSWRQSGSENSSATGSSRPFPRARPSVLEAPGGIAVHRQRLLERRRFGDVLADQTVVMRIAGDDGAVAVNHRDRGVAVQRQGSDEILEMRRVRRPGSQSRSARRGGR